MHSPVLVIDGKPVELKSNSEKDIKKAILNKIENQNDCNKCFCGGKC
jgi:hypothetical protein